MGNRLVVPQRVKYRIILLPNNFTPRYRLKEYKMDSDISKPILIAFSTVLKSGNNPSIEKHINVLDAEKPFDTNKHAQTPAGCPTT